MGLCCFREQYKPIQCLDISSMQWRHTNCCSLCSLCHCSKFTSVKNLIRQNLDYTRQIRYWQCNRKQYRYLTDFHKHPLQTVFYREWLIILQASSRGGSRRAMLHTYAWLKLSRTDTPMDRCTDRHCVTIRLQAGSRGGSRRAMLRTYASLKLSRTDAHTDRWMDRHCATIRAT